MKTSKFSKILSVLLAVLMLISSVPASVFAAEESYPVMMATNAASSKGYYKYYDKIVTVTFLDEIKIEGNPLEQWDMSANGDGSVRGWMYLNEEATAAAGANRYDVFVAGDGGVAAHPDSTHFFYVFKSLKEIKGMENFHTGSVKKFYFWFGNCNELESVDLSYLDTSSATSFELFFYACYKLKEIDASSWDVSNVTTIKDMFQRCYALETANLGGWNTSKVTNMCGVFDMNPHAGAPEYSLKNVNLSGWDTSNVTTMENMFRNCEALTTLDLSSFNTAKVTTMRFMFYCCKNLKYIYAGEGWTTESIANLNDGIFNCCYALIGQTDNQTENEKIYAEKHPSAYYPPAAEYAKFREDGGYLTNASQKPAEKQYNVTYAFIGDIIPEGVAAPDAATYEEGTTVTVADNASAKHYIFSGWTTEDAEVVNGEFVINNDVHFVGSWTKLYKVEYKYDDNYKLPPDYPEIPDVELWFAPGEDVPVYGIPYAPDHIFVGWNTGDAEIIGDSFVMPENDVVLYGYYKIPVNSIEIEGGDLTIDIGGEKVKVEVYVDPPEATFDGVEFESGDESIVKVDKDGNLEPVGVGTTTITITSKDDPTKTDTVNVTVKIPVTDITVDRNKIDLNKGDTDKITVTEVKPAEATNKDVTYESSDETVVKVDENGNIVAVGDGTATITVTSKDNKTVKETVTVTVKTPVTELTVTEDFTLNVGEEKNVEAKVNEDATEKGIIYETSDPGVAKIDNDGNVIAVGEGTATITVTSKDDPAFKETVTVTVKIPVTDITVDEKDITLGKGDKDKINITVTPDDATNKEVTFKSDDETVVKVDKDGNIEAVNPGTTTITITSNDNPDVSEVVTVTVVPKYKVVYIIENAKEAGYNETPADESYKAGVTVTVAERPELEGYSFVGWYPDDSDLINVVDNEFTMPSSDVILYGRFDKLVSGVEINNKETISTLEKGDEITIEVKVTPEDASDKGVAFDSSDETVVKVDENGKITAVGSGTATITVTSKENPEIYDTVTVTVLKEYKVNYKFDGDVIPEGVTAPKEAAYTEGSTVNVEKVPTVAGYTFSGWETKDADVADGKFVINNDVEFVGRWTKINYYNVTYVVDGNVPENYKAPEAKTYREGSYIPVEAVPSEKGYRFEGWTSDDADITSGGLTVNKNIVIKGTWVKLYNVTYEYEGDVPADAPKLPEATSYDEGTEVAVTEAPRADGYIFEGWTANTDITDGKVIADKDIVITGKWTKLYNVTYEYIGEVPEGAPEAPAYAEYKAGTDVTVEAVPAVAGYTFHGWTTEDVTVEADGFEMPAKNVVLKGYFTKNVTGITTNKNEIELEVGDEDNIVVTVTPDDASDKSVTFDSSDKAVVTVDENGKITAVGEGEATITVTSKENSDISVTINVTVKVPEVPEEPTEPDVPEVPEEPTEPEEPDYTIEAPDGLNVYIGETINVGISIVPDDGKLKPTYKSSDESIVTVDAEGNITGISAGSAIITASFSNGEIITIPVMVIAPAPIPTKHHIVFGKTDGIGWYEVSVNGGDFFPQGPNSTLEVEEGSILVVRVQDMWIDDEFDFYVNGKKVPMDPANTITVVVDGYMLIGALSMDAEVPDVEESVSLLDKIKNFFLDIINWFKNLFS